MAVISQKYSELLSHTRTEQGAHGSQSHRLLACAWRIHTLRDILPFVDGEDWLLTLWDKIGAGL